MVGSKKEGMNRSLKKRQGYVNPRKKGWMDGSKKGRM